MPATTEPSQQLLEHTRDRYHAGCVVCSAWGPAALGLEFAVTDDGVTGTFPCPPRFEGYDGMLHGGVISAIADGAMTNCLFAEGIAAVTAELKVRFRHPVVLGKRLTVMARTTRRNAPLFVLEARLVQDGKLKATATGKFMQTPGDASK
ncbi:MAG: PaaI family thioesterase [Planctomycetota bacterium]